MAEARLKGSPGNTFFNLFTGKVPLLLGKTYNEREFFHKDLAIRHLWTMSFYAIIIYVKNKLRGHNYML